MDINDFDIAFDLMGETITFGLTSFKGFFDCPDEIIGGMSISPEYTITAKTSDLAGIVQDSVLVIGGTSYEVRKIMKLDDGLISRVYLSKQ